MSDLIDTTEMYLKVIFEMVEDGVVPKRSRLATRLGQAMPTVSQTVDRMIREGLLLLNSERTLEFTAMGEKQAIAVMRKHRIAEVFLTEVLGFSWVDAHEEACRWEHVISEEAERKMLNKLSSFEFDPYGNRIPGLDELGFPAIQTQESLAVSAIDIGLLDEVAATVVSVSEPLQAHLDELQQLHALGIMPGATVTINRDETGYLLKAAEFTEALHIDREISDYIRVSLK